MTQFAWTDDRVETLKTLWAEGHSCSQIARQFGCGLSRNAVIGKVHRLGLPGRSVAKLMVRDARMPRAARAIVPGHVAPAIVKPVPLPPVEPALTGAEPTLPDLTRTACRWPVGEADGWQQQFCGAPRDGGSSYCAFHARKAINPQPRKASTGLLDQMGRRTPMVAR